MINSIKLAQALNEKLCHDFAGSIGAIDNCTDLIESIDDVTRRKAADIIRISAQTLINYLKFYRYLYSEAPLDSQVNFAEICNITHGFVELKNSTIKFEIIPSKSCTISATIAQLIMGFVSLAVDDLTHDGVIKLNLFFDNGFFNIKTIVQSSKLKFHQQKFDNLTNKNHINNLSTHYSHEYYIYCLTKNLGYKIEVVQSNNKIEYNCIYAKN